MRNLYMTLVIMLICGCSTNQRPNDYASIVDEWQGKFVELPSIMTDILSGDTICQDNADYVILTYVDSAGCTSCNMKPQLWNEFFKSLNNISDAEIMPIMIVCKRDQKEVSYLLKRYAYHYPVYLDEIDMINKKNTFPSDPMLQTFLLDKNHKVVAIGNPIYSDAIADLYKSIISCKQVFSSDLKSMVRMEPNMIDVGIIGRRDLVSGSIKIHNIGNDTVFIRSILSSCDCTEANLAPEYIAPNRESSLDWTFKADDIIGDFERSINVYFKDFDNPSIVRIYGKVE